MNNDVILIDLASFKFECYFSIVSIYSQVVKLIPKEELDGYHWYVYLQYI
jgi:hypothetical protein